MAIVFWVVLAATFSVTYDVFTYEDRLKKWKGDLRDPR